MKAEKIKVIIDKIIQAIDERKNMEGEIELMPDGNFHIYLRPWKPYEMKCPYDKKPEETEQ